MVIEFSLGNFRSFKEVQTLHFQAANIKSKYSFVDENNIFHANEKYDLLKSKVIYGANASGKSNLIRGLATMLLIVRHSFRDNEIIEKAIEPFRLSEETIGKPTFFQITFILENIHYRYGMQLKDGKVTDEWLFGTPEKREVYFFIREGQKVKINENQFKEALKIIPRTEDETPIYGQSSLFLSTAAATNRHLATEIVNYFKKTTVLFGLNDNSLMELVKTRLEHDSSFNKKLVVLLNSIGMEIDSLHLESSENESSYIELVRRFNSGSEGQSYVNFNLDEHGAEGTKKMIALSPAIFLALANGSALFIDEFDARLHPRLSRKIVELFNSNETNPHNAQLVIISHDTNLMDAHLFRRDQISFVDMNEEQASKLYSLVEYKGIRNNSSFEKDYLKGKYGAVPFLNKLDNLFINEKTL